MKSVSLEYKESCLLTPHELDSMLVSLKPEIERVSKAYTRSYETDYASVHLPFDEDLLKAVNATIAEKRKLQPSLLVVVGIGGSNLGTLGVQQAIYGALYNELNPEIKIYYADTVDADHTYAILQMVEQELQQNKNVIINLVSKSGSTTESIANFELFLDVIKRYKKDSYAENIVVTTDAGSKLWHLAQQEKFSILEIPKLVGGRYSVLSAVGLFPLGLIGIDIDQLRAGARSIVSSCTDMHNAAALSACIIAWHYAKGKNIHDTFLFSVALEGIGRWYRQLVGESLGKEYDRNGKLAERGITPTISIGSTDLHSVAQLYLGGPRDKFTSFVIVSETNEQLQIPDFPTFDALVANIQKRSLADVMHAIIQGTQIAYMHGRRPFVTWTLQEKSPFYIGQLLQAKMIEMMYLGFLLNVNPFDQPNVESYKQETRKILANE